MYTGRRIAWHRTQGRKNMTPPGCVSARAPETARDHEQLQLQVDHILFVEKKKRRTKKKKKKKI